MEAAKDEGKITMPDDFSIKIDDNLIKYLEDLSNLTLTKEEKSTVKRDLKTILSNISKLGRLDTEGIPERSHPFDNVNAFREDEIIPHLDRDLILKNAPFKNEEMIIAPKTVD